MTDGAPRRRAQRGGTPDIHIVRDDEPGPKVRPMKAEDERALRQRAILELTKELTGLDRVALVGDDVEWFEHDGQHWQGTTSKEMDALAIQMLGEWWGKDDVKAQAAGTAAMWKRTDAGEIVAHVLAKSQPPGWDRLEARDRERPFNLDTGDLIHGIPFDDCFVKVTESGEIEEWDLEARDFTRWTTGYAWAGEQSGPPPNFGDWLEFLLPGDEEDQDRLCAIVGAVLAGDLPSLQAMLLLIGEGGTGKGTLQKLIDLMHGGDASYGVRSPTQLANRFALSHLRGKHIIVVADMSRRPGRGSAQADFDAGMGTLKNLTGGDPVDVEIKNQQSHSRVLDVAVLVGSNFEPRWIVGSEDASAWERRLLPFQFLSKPAHASARFLDTTLVPELPAISAWCVTAYADRLRHARAEQRDIETDDFRSEAMRRRIARIIEAARGEAGVFVAQELGLAGDPQEFVTRKALAAAFAEFLGHEELKDGQRYALFREIEFAFPAIEHNKQKRIGGKAQRGYAGIALLNHDDDPFDDDDDDLGDGMPETMFPDHAPLTPRARRCRSSTVTPSDATGAMLPSAGRAPSTTP